MPVRRFIELDAEGRVRAQLEASRESWEGVTTPSALVDVTDLQSAAADLLGCAFDATARTFGSKPPRVVRDRLAELAQRVEAIATRVGA